MSLERDADKESRKNIGIGGIGLLLYLRVVLRLISLVAQTDTER